MISKSGLILMRLSCRKICRWRLNPRLWTQWRPVGVGLTSGYSRVCLCVLGTTVYHRLRKQIQRSQQTRTRFLFKAPNVRNEGLVCETRVSRREGSAALRRPPHPGTPESSRRLLSPPAVSAWAGCCGRAARRGSDTTAASEITTRAACRARNRAAFCCCCCCWFIRRKSILTT